MTTEPQTIYTIGVYGSTEESFFGALIEHEIQLFIDIRARRGLRGSKYRYANSSYLQARLNELGIYYAHLKELAPTTEIRALQWQADKDEKTLKRERTGLSKAYVKAYKRDILRVYKRKPESKLDFEEVLSTATVLADCLPERQLRKIALFCVEQSAAACHRSLVAEAWGSQQAVGIKHISG